MYALHFFLGKIRTALLFVRTYKITKLALLITDEPILLPIFQ